MPPPSLAREFFDQIRTAADPVAFLTGLVNPANPTFEGDWLDFKTQPDKDLKAPKWREMWVEALAGFANNAGGVLVWGIDARVDPATKVSAACGVKPVDNPAGVKSRLIELQRQATPRSPTSRSTTTSSRRPRARGSSCASSRRDPTSPTGPSSRGSPTGRSVRATTSRS